VFFDVMLAAAEAVDESGREAVKTVARALSSRLPSKLVIDWRKSEQKRAGVLSLIEEVLEETPYEGPAYQRACEEVFKHVYESYWGDGKSKFNASA
jgi:type I restriction enzyme, R subunit